MKQKKYKLVKLFFIILTIVLLKNHSFTKDRHNDLFNEAILEYKNVNYNASLEKFLTINDELLKENKISSEILYNIGNCYYRLNKLGMAKFYYELAKMYNYKDINIKYNINLINKLTNNMEPINIINTISNFFSFEVLFT
ncbi:MAG: hypothetical protein N2505_06965, partial [Endomicrobia bacterium]|nr:hypothetical protein [Endomicrobiia bacterium]